METSKGFRRNPTRLLDRYSKTALGLSRYNAGSRHRVPSRSDRDPRGLSCQASMPVAVHSRHRVCSPSPPGNSVPSNRSDSNSSVSISAEPSINPLTFVSPPRPERCVQYPSQVPCCVSARTSVPKPQERIDPTEIEFTETHETRIIDALSFQSPST